MELAFRNDLKGTIMQHGNNRGTNSVTKRVARGADPGVCSARGRLVPFPSRLRVFQSCVSQTACGHWAAESNG